MTTAAGAELGLGRSLVRASVLLIPFFLNGAAIPLRLLRSPGIAAAFSVAVFGLGVSIVYLFLCNRRTRQSLHDLVVGSYVVRVGAEAEAKPQMWRGHYAVVGLALLVAAVLPVALQGVMQKGFLAELMPAYDAVTAEPEVTAAQVVAGTNYFWDSHGKRTTTSVSAVVRVNRPIDDKEAEAVKIAGIILRSYPAAVRQDAITITIAQGFDIGIASGFVSQGFAYSPSDWREKIGAAPALGATQAPASPIPTRR